MSSWIKKPSAESTTLKKQILEEQSYTSSRISVLYTNHQFIDDNRSSMIGSKTAMKRNYSINGVKARGMTIINENPANGAKRLKKRLPCCVL